MLLFENTVLDAICSSFVDPVLEQGGILGTSTDLQHISNFWLDINAQASTVSYIPSALEIHRQIKLWADNGICFCGIIHSHITGNGELSEQDQRYIYGVLQSFPHMPYLWFPIVSRKTNECSILSYRCFLKDGILNCKLDSTERVQYDCIAANPIMPYCHEI